MKKFSWKTARSSRMTYTHIARLDGSKCRILEFITHDVLQMDPRRLAQFGIGSDVTEWYLGLKQ